MTPESLQQRLLRIQMRFEAYDQHNPECNCLFCDALAALSELRSELRTVELQQLKQGLIGIARERAASA